MVFSLRHLIVGSPLRTAEQAHERLTKTKALAIFSSDALSSVAYATEEILLVLVAVGMAAFYLSMPIALTITALLVIVVTSYYPDDPRLSCRMCHTICISKGSYGLSKRESRLTETGHVEYHAPVLRPEGCKPR